MPLPEHLRRLLAECDVEAYASPGPGGQKKNRTASSVRIRHRPTGVVRIATESRSQTRNKALALERLGEALAARARRPRPRIATRPSAASGERRLEAKRLVAGKKRLRSPP